VPTTTANPHSLKSARKPGLFTPRVNARKLALFTRQLSTMLNSGLPLLRALQVLERQQSDKHFRKVLKSLGEQVSSGSQLSQAMDAYSSDFDELYRNMVRAGEASGALDVVLGKLAEFLEKSIRLKGKLASAMVYPIIVLSLSMTILTGLLVFVVPRFEGIYANALKGSSLPWLTQVVLDLSRWVQGNVTWLLIGGGVLMIALILGLRTQAGRSMADLLKLKIPVVGRLLQMSILARFSRTLGTLQSTAVPLLDALQITRGVVVNHRYQMEVDELHKRVKDGEPISEPLKRSKLFPEMMTSLVEVGEETGSLPEMLERIADNNEEDLDLRIGGLTSIIEPVMIIFLAVVVGGMVVAMFLPIVDIMQSLDF